MVLRGLPSFGSKSRAISVVGLGRQTARKAFACCCPEYWWGPKWQPPPSRPAPPAWPRRTPDDGSTQSPPSVALWITPRILLRRRTRVKSVTVTLWLMSITGSNPDTEGPGAGGWVLL